MQSILAVSVHNSNRCDWPAISGPKRKKGFGPPFSLTSKENAAYKRLFRNRSPAVTKLRYAPDKALASAGAFWFELFEERPGPALPFDGHAPVSRNVAGPSPALYDQLSAAIFNVNGLGAILPGEYPDGSTAVVPRTKAARKQFRSGPDKFNFLELFSFHVDILASMCQKISILRRAIVFAKPSAARISQSR